MFARSRFCTNTCTFIFLVVISLCTNSLQKMQNKLGLSPNGKSFSNPPTLCPTAERGGGGNGGKRCSIVPIIDLFFVFPFFHPNQHPVSSSPPFLHTHVLLSSLAWAHETKQGGAKNIISLKNNLISHTHKLHIKTISQCYLNFCCILPCLRGKGGRGGQPPPASVVTDIPFPSSFPLSRGGKLSMHR